MEVLLYRSDAEEHFLPIEFSNRIGFGIYAIIFFWKQNNKN